MSYDDPVTLGELLRRIDRFESAMATSLDRLVSKEAYDALVDDVTELRDSRKWLARAVALQFIVMVGTILTALVLRGVPAS